MTQDLTVKSSRQADRRRGSNKTDQRNHFESNRKHESSDRRRRINDVRAREAAIY